MRPDVGVIHAQKADGEGNVLVEGIIGVQKQAVLAARAPSSRSKSVVDDVRTAHPERRASCRTGRLTRSRWCRGGARPSYAHGYYERDNAFYIAWDDDRADRATFLQWLDEHVMHRGRASAA